MPDETPVFGQKFIRHGHNNSQSYCVVIDVFADIVTYALESRITPVKIDLLSFTDAVEAGAFELVDQFPRHIQKEI